MEREKPKEYEKPELQLLGTIEELTQTGLTVPGTDGKDGSVTFSQGQ
jgi:hypothetical protein